MKEVYPRSTTWPYVLVVAALFCGAVRPVHHWVHTWEAARRHVVAGAMKTARRVSRPPKRPVLRHAAEVAVASTNSRQVSPPPATARSSDDASPPAASNAATRAVSDAARTNPEQTAAKTASSPPPASWSARPIQPLPASSTSSIDAPIKPRADQITAVKLTLPSRPSREAPQLNLPANLPDATGGGQTGGNPNAATPSPIDNDGLNRQPTEQGDLNLDTDGSWANNRRPWPRSEVLHQLLDQANDNDQLRRWADDIRRSLLALEEQTNARDSLALARKLEGLSRPPVRHAAWNHEQRQLARRISYAVRRRTDVWQPLLSVASSTDASAKKQTLGAPLRRALAAFQATLSRHAHGDTWDAYLALSDLEARLGRRGDPGRIADRAEETLARFDAAELTPRQRSFLARPAATAVRDHLRAVVAASVSPWDVIGAIEAYEARPDRQRSSVVVQRWQRWLRHGGDRRQAAGRAMATHYRNANLRIALSQDLLNRLIPAMHKYAEQVNDTILGAEVRGKNSTSTVLSVALVPDPRRIQLKLLAQGQIQSSTASRKGPVTIFNRGNSTFSADKRLIISPAGIYTTRTQAEATTGTRLVDLRSDLDDLPLVGLVVRMVARQQHDDQRTKLRAEIMRRVRRSASQKMDREVQQRLSNVEQRINQRVLDPLKEMNLDPQAMEMRTTADRVIMRSRLASPSQLGAHTPRPRARADSLFSLQLHQTAANNLIEQLRLHGRRMTLAELAHTLAEKLNMADLRIDEKYEDVVVRFAERHPFEFEFDNGKITLTIHLAELDNGRRVWRNFSARGYYQADIDQLDVELVRDAGIELISEQLGLRDQLALRSIFTKVLARHHRLRILRQTLAKQPRLRGLEVSQLAIRDGWLGLSVGENPNVRLVDRAPSNAVYVSRKKDEPKALASGSSR